MPQIEVHTVVVYDVSDDRTRTRVSEACKDFGLARFQYSAFVGLLTRNRREELGLVLAKLMEKKGGKAAVIPICAGDFSERIVVEIEPTAGEAKRETLLKVFAGGEEDEEES